MSKFSRTAPYNRLPDLPPKKDTESREILKKAILAHRSLAKLAASARGLPDQFLLINSLSLPEAIMSVELADIITRQEELYLAFSSDKIITNTVHKEVLYYREALLQGYHFVKEKRSIDVNLLVKIFNTIKNTDEGIRNTTDTTNLNTSTGEIIYTPPQGEKLIRQKLRNLEDYINATDDDTETLVRMAIIHYQFNAIHPFKDGNGRTGRILTLLFLVLNNLVEWPVFYLSQYLIENNDAYHKSLNKVTGENKWKPWVFFMLDAVEKTARYTQQKIESILALMRDTGRFIQQKAPEIYSEELLGIIFSQPYCKRKFLEDARIVKKKTAGVYLSVLEEIGLMKSIRAGKEKLYINQALMDILKN